MDPIVSIIYLSEIKAQCEFAISAFLKIKSLVESPNDTDYKEFEEIIFDLNFKKMDRFLNPDRNEIIKRIKEEGLHDLAVNRDLFRNISSFLSHVGNISKLLDPCTSKNNKVKRESRGNELCQILGINKADFNFFDRSFRNDLEHYDERIDSWIENAPEIEDRKVLTAVTYCAVNTRVDWENLGKLKNKVLKGFIKDTYTFCFKGNELDLSELYSELMIIKDLL